MFHITMFHVTMFHMPCGSACHVAPQCHVAPRRHASTQVSPPLGLRPRTTALGPSLIATCERTALRHAPSCHSTHNLSISWGCCQFMYRDEAMVYNGRGGTHIAFLCRSLFAPRCLEPSTSRPDATAASIARTVARSGNVKR
jgi:hypothetical protein